MITLLASIAGFMTSLIPEIMKFFKDKNDKKHEIMLFELQIQNMAKTKIHELEEVRLSRDMHHLNHLYSTYNTGINWVDALNGTVRPVLAYSFFLMYLWVKFIQYLYLSNHNILPEYMNLLWDVDDQAIFAGIISFYFGQRGFKKYKRPKK